MAVHEEERRGVLDLFADFGEENENKVAGEDEMIVILTLNMQISR